MQALLEEKQHLLAPHFKPAMLQRERTCFQFCFDVGEPFNLVVTTTGFEFIEGMHSSPTVTLCINNHETFWDLLEGRSDSMEAFMSGSYRADGNIVLSQLLLYLFKADDPTIAYRVQD